MGYVVARILAIDPGARPGFAVLTDGVITKAGWRPEEFDGVDYDEVVVEDQFAAAHIFRSGKKVRVSRAAQQTLSWTAGRLFERFRAQAKFRVPVSTWRRALWGPSAGRLPKPVVLARGKPLVPEAWWRDVPASHQPDVIEACLIGLAWATKMTHAARKKCLVKT